MSRFKQAAHVLWCHHYHIVWTPKYRYRILEGEVKVAVERSIRICSERLDCTIIELNIQADHVHLVVQIPPKISMSDYVGTIKGKTAITVFKQFPKLKVRPYWGNKFWAQGYCSDTVGVNLEMIRRYVKYQERQEKLVNS